MLQNFIKSYAPTTQGVSYRHTALVSHGGVVIGFALDSEQQFWYTVLDLENDKIKSPIDVNYWLKEPLPVLFPKELSQVGYSIAGNQTMPDPTAEVLADGTVEVKAEKEKTLRERFLGSTARLTADAPFQVMSDGQYIYLFRQAIGADHPQMVTVGDVPIVNNTLLLDRFVFTGLELKPKLEVRYQRSRSKDRPLNRKDSLDSQDLERKPFYEPTQELEMVRHLSEGRFAVALVPSAVPNIKRWQIFAHNSRSGLIDSFNIERSSDGLFNPRGSQFYTCETHPEVFELMPGTCPECASDLVPKATREGQAESALQLNGSSATVKTGLKDLSVPGLTIELWFKGDKPDGLVLQQAGDRCIGLLEGRWVLANEGGAKKGLAIGPPASDGGWHHLAMTWQPDSKNGFVSYLDGRVVERRDSGKEPLPKLNVALLLGGEKGKAFARGCLDEVRIWKRARSQNELKADQHRRLVGYEDGLLAYWRLDEASGKTVHDQSDNGYHGTIQGQASWVDSDAPLGDNPGVNRSSFALEGTTIAGGLSALLYHQQEKRQSGYSGAAKPIKKNSRLMLAVVTRKSPQAKQHIAVLDFGLNREGKLSLVPDSLKLPLLGSDEASGSINEALDRRSGLDGEIVRLNQSISDLKQRIEALLASSKEWDSSLLSLDEKIRIKQDFVNRENSYQESKQQALAVLENISNCAIEHNGPDKRYTFGIQPNSDPLSYRRSISLRNREKGDIFYYMQTFIYLYASPELHASVRWSVSMLGHTFNNTSEFIGKGLLSELKHNTFLGGRPSSFYDDPKCTAEYNLDVRLSPHGIDVFTKAKQKLDQAILNLSKAALIREELAALYRDQADTSFAKETFSITLEGYRNELAAKQQELNQKEVERATMLNHQLGEVRVPMRLLHTDHFGLTVCGGLLSFAYTSDSPTLFDSATGKVGLYFRGASEDQFFAAYFDTLTERVVHTLPASSGQLVLEARSTEAELDHTSLGVAPGSRNDTCTLTITNATTGLSETWPDLPRAVHAFTQILNGNGLPPLPPPVQASTPVVVANQATAAIPPITEAERQKQLDALAATYPVNSSVQSQVKALKALMPSDPAYPAAQEALGATIQQLTPAVPEPEAPSEDDASSRQQPAYYDYSQVRVSQPDKRIEQGSLFFNVFLADAQGEVQDTAVPIQLGAVNTRVSEWVADSQGNALFLNGETSLAKPEATLPVERFDLPGDLTLETWVNALEAKGDQAVALINHNTAQSQYYLGLVGVVPGKSLNFNGSNTYIETGLRDLSGSALTIEYWFKGKRLSAAVAQQAGEQSLVSGWIKPPNVPRAMGSLAFNGSDQYLEVPYHEALNPKQFTVSLWLRHTNVEVGYHRSVITSRGGVPSEGYIIYVLENGACSFWIGHGKAWTEATSPAAAITPNTWTHIGATYDGKTLRLYLNGKEVAFAAQSAPAYNTEYPLRIAAGKTESEWPGYFFPGCISELSLWNRALTGREIQQGMNRQLKGKEEGLVAYFPLQGIQTDNDTQLVAELVAGRNATANGPVSASSEAPFTPKPEEASSLVLQRLQAHSTDTSLPIKGALYDHRWHHVALTWQQGQAKGFVSYVDGDVVAQGPAADLPIPRLDAPLLLGAAGPEGPFLDGSIAEVRIWKVARSQNQIRATMRKRIRTAMPGLLASWSLMDEDLKDYSGNGYHGSLRGAASSSLSYPIQAAYAVASVGRERVQSEQFAYLDGWLHVASAFNQSYALRFDGVDDYLNAGQAADLNLTQELTIEAFLLMDTGSERGVITKGRLDDGGDQDVPYSLTIDPDGRLVFAFERSDHKKEVCSSMTTIPSGQFCKVAVVRSQGIDRKENKVKKVVEGKEVEMLESVDVKNWQLVCFYINGQFAGSKRYEDIKPGTTDHPLEIGKTYRRGGSAAFFKGILSEVRLWGRALPAGELGAAIKGHEQGLAAWWRFEENAGNTAFDSKGSNHCERNGARWVKNPDPRGSSFLLYFNGVSQKLQPFDSIDQGSPGFSIGGVLNNSKPQALLKGSLEETRIWRSSRSEEQIQDNLFRRLLGERKELHAYYQYDADLNNRLSDCSGRAHHLTVIEPDWQISNAPVSYETPQVRSALAGVTTDFHGRIESAPAVQEYGDIQYNDERELLGVMKRCYSYIKAGEWQLITGFKIGNVITEWVGQAQYEPQIIGFIEGAPPVPSENCTVFADADYAGGSSVEIVEADNVQYSLGASRESTLDAAFRLAAKVGGALETMVVAAPVGAGMAQEVAEVTFEANLEGNIDISNGWSSESSVSSGKNISKQTRVTAMGSWESDTSILNPEIGKRFVFNNVGFALVQSDTADIYALRMEHNQALIAYRFQPNPDIPKDWNLVPFQMNPRYVRQGTLDGRVGMTERGNVYDPNYANARDYGEYSYYKPREAYLLKNQISLAEIDLKTYYTNFSTSPLDADRAGKGAGIGAATGMAIGSLLGPVGMAIGAAGGAVAGSLIGGLTGDKSLPKKLSKRNLVNTYVWTADGGFFAETTELSETMSETVGGSFSLGGAVSFGMTLDAEIGAVTTGFEMEASIGGSINLTKTKTRDSEHSFSLSVDLSVPNNLQKFNAGNPVYDPQGNPVLQPGKVDAYRFMTFYLEPSVQNFDMFVNKVVDPIWLQQSRHPNASTLRGALKSQQKTNKNTQKSAPWRVLHRVTFVSRVLPPIEPGKEPQTPEQLLKASEIDSNYELIKRLEPFVSDKVDDYLKFTNAVRETIDTYIPELKPAKDYIVEYMCQYFQVFDGMI